MSSRISNSRYKLPLVGIDKICSKCNKEKDRSLFYDSPKNKDKKKPHCIECDIEYKKLYYEKNSDRIKKKVQDLYYSDIEKSRERTRNAMREFIKRNPFYYSRINEDRVLYS